MDKKEMVEKALSETISCNTLMVMLSQYDGRFPVCFKDDKNNMIPMAIDSVNMSNINILLPNHTHIFGVPAIVIDLPNTTTNKT